MGKPAARLSDFHVCPKVNPGPVPHVGGPIAIGSPNVIIGSLLAARVGDMAVCVGPPDKVSTGSSGVFINGKAAARLGDSSAHGGKIVVGCPTVLIGGQGGGGGAGGTANSETVGSTLGNPQAGLAAFTGLAVTRVSGSTQQTYGNCGVESTRQFMSNPRSELEVLQDAINNGNAEYDPDPLLAGGTSPLGRQSILTNSGVASHLEPQTAENIQQAVIEGKGVITSHDAGTLWGDPGISGGHAVAVTGVTYDNSGAVESYVINDTGTGEGASKVPAAQFENSLRPNRQINVTDNPIW